MCPVRLFDGLHYAPVLWKHPDVTMPHTQCNIPPNRCVCSLPDWCRPHQTEAQRQGNVLGLGLKQVLCNSIFDLSAALSLPR